MQPESLLPGLLVGVFYPLWLGAGLIDYICHRRSSIEHTSGARESWFHVAEFASLGVFFSLVVLLEVNPLVFTVLVAAVAVHTVLSYADVSYTDGRRYISPLEQHAHGFMSTLPIVALAIIAVLDWNSITAGAWALHWKAVPMTATQTSLLLGSYFILAGVPIFEELLRTSSKP